MTFPVETADQLLDVWRAGMSSDYRRGLETESDGIGFDIVVAQAAIFERVALAVATTTQAYYLRPHSTQIAPCAAGEARATGFVTMSRRPPAEGPFSFPAGLRIRALVHDVDGELIEAATYRTTAVADFPAGFLGPLSVPIEAERPGYQANLPLGRPLVFAEAGRFAVPGTLASGVSFSDTAGVPDCIVPDLLGRYVRFTGFAGDANAFAYPRKILSVVLDDAANTVEVDGPALVNGSGTMEVEEMEDLGFVVEMSTMFSGGRHAWEDAIGEERECHRQAGESDAAYRKRIEGLADVVSPASIVRLCERILTPAGIAWELIEAGDPVDYEGAEWTPTSYLGLDGSFIGSLVSYDFATMDGPFFAILVALPSDDMGTHLDTIDEFDETAIDDEAITDGYDPTWNAVMMQIFAQVNQIKSAGVGWAILLDLPTPTPPP